MDKQYTFDASCNMNDNAKAELIKKVEKWKNECKLIEIGPYTCRIHPTTISHCKKITGMDYEDLLDQLLGEISKGDDKETALKNLFDIYGEVFDENKISGLINFAMDNIVSDFANVKVGNLPKVGSFRDMLLRELAPVKLLKAAKQHKEFTAI